MDMQKFEDILREHKYGVPDSDYIGSLSSLKEPHIFHWDFEQYGGNTIRRITITNVKYDLDLEPDENPILVKGCIEIENAAKIVDVDFKLYKSVVQINTDIERFPYTEAQKDIIMTRIKEIARRSKIAIGDYEAMREDKFNTTGLICIVLGAIGAFCWCWLLKGC